MKPDDDIALATGDAASMEGLDEGGHHPPSNIKLVGGEQDNVDKKAVIVSSSSQPESHDSEDIDSVDTIGKAIETTTTEDDDDDDDRQSISKKATVTVNTVEDDSEADDETNAKVKLTAHSPLTHY